MRAIKGLFILFLIVGCQSVDLKSSKMSLPFTIKTKYKNPDLRWKEFVTHNFSESKKLAISQQDYIQKMLMPSADPYSGEITSPSACLPTVLPETRIIDSGQNYIMFSSVYVSPLFNIDCTHPNKIKAQSVLLACDNKVYWILAKLTDVKTDWPDEAIADCK